MITMKTVALAALAVWVCGCSVKLSDLAQAGVGIGFGGDGEGMLIATFSTHCREFVNGDPGGRIEVDGTTIVEMAPGDGVLGGREVFLPNGDCLHYGVGGAVPEDHRAAPTMSFVFDDGIDEVVAEITAPLAPRTIEGPVTAAAGDLIELTWTTTTDQLLSGAGLSITDVVACTEPVDDRGRCPFGGVPLDSEIEGTTIRVTLGAETGSLTLIAEGIGVQTPVTACPAAECVAELFLTVPPSLAIDVQ